MKVEMEVDEDGFLLFPFFFCFGTVGCLRMLFPFLFFSYRDIKKKRGGGKGRMQVSGISSTVVYLAWTREKLRNPEGY